MIYKSASVNLQMFFEKGLRVIGVHGEPSFG